MERFHGQGFCRLDKPEAAALAAKQELTRSAAAMRLSAAQMTGAIVAIGNAPTALLEVLRLANEGKGNPALVIGVPVGFVNASESKRNADGLPPGLHHHFGPKGRLDCRRGHSQRLTTAGRRIKECAPVLLPAPALPPPRQRR